MNEEYDPDYAGPIIPCEYPEPQPYRPKEWDYTTPDTPEMVVGMTPVIPVIDEEQK